MVSETVKYKIKRSILKPGPFQDKICTHGSQDPSILNRCLLTQTYHSAALWHSVLHHVGSLVVLTVATFSILMSFLSYLFIQSLPFVEIILTHSSKFISGFFSKVLLLVVPCADECLFSDFS